MISADGYQAEANPCPQAAAEGELYVRVGRLVREARDKKGLSQSELGAPFFTRAMVSAVALGKISPALKTLAHFAAKLEVPLKDLIPD